jgi:GGDEF domain-containing protein/predicted DNA-binding protein
MAFDLEATLERLRKRDAGEIALVLFDLDDFRRLSGSAARTSAQGSAEIARLNRTVATEFGSAAIFAYSRDGCAVLVRTSGANALLAADRVRALHEPGPGRNSICTVSAGIAASRMRRGLDASGLLWAAAGALARAKSEGRNRSCSAETDAMAMKSTYYPRSQLERLSSLATRAERSEASLLREALEYLLASYEDRYEHTTMSTRAFPIASPAARPSRRSKSQPLHRRGQS